MRLRFILQSVLPVLSALVMLTGCISSEPLEIQCDIETITLSTLDGSSVLRSQNNKSYSYSKSEQLTVQSDLSDSVYNFYVQEGGSVSSYKVNFSCHAGTKVYLVSSDGNEEAFVDGSTVDFTNYSGTRVFVTESEGQYTNKADKQSYTSTRRYYLTVSIDMNTAADSVLVDFNGNYALNDKGKYYVWTEPEKNGILFNGNDRTWKNGNPGYTLSKGTALPMEYPTVPVVNGGMDGTDCVKLETCSTGSFGDMVHLPTASGSLFNGSFDVSNATKAPRKATQFGVPCTCIPQTLEADLKYIPGATFQDQDKNPVAGVVDEPDIYCIFYNNHSGTVTLDGDNILTSSDIVASARLKHHYTYNTEGNRKVPVPQLSGDPIHGITSEWQHVKLELNFDPFQTGTKNEIDLATLKNHGYSVVFGSTSSWRGAVFQGAIGSQLYMDNVKIKFSNPGGGDTPTGDTKIEFNFASDFSTDKGYYEWTNSKLGGAWQSVNPIFKVLRNGAQLDEFPAIPASSGETKVLKLETKSAGTYAPMLKMNSVPGIIYNGTQESYSLTDAMSGGATYFQSRMQMGRPFTHKPTKMVVRAKYTPGSKYYIGNTYAEGVVDVPDIWCVFYRNMGEQVTLTGSDLFTNPNIAGYARLHSLGKTVGTEWTEIEMDVPTYNVDAQELAKGGYSLVIGATSSCKGMDFEGAEGSTLEIGSITIYYE